MHIKTKKINFYTSDQILSNTVVLFYFSRILNNVFKRILPISDITILILSLIPLIIYILINSKFLCKKCGLIFFITQILIFFLYFFAFMNPVCKINVITSFYFNTALICVPVACVVYKIQNYHILYECFKRYSIYMFVVLMLIYLKIDNFVYIMSHSYLLLIPTFIHLNELLEQKKLSYLILFSIEIYTILIVGSRGPILAIMVFLVYKYLIVENRLIRKGLFVFSIIVLVLLYFQFRNDLLLYLNSIGIHSRSLSLLLSDLEYSSGRNLIQEQTIELIKQNWLTGVGITNDFSLINAYPHNILLEIIVDYGVPLGSLIFIVINIMIVYCMKNFKEQKIFPIFLCVGYVTLFVSESYLESYNFFILLFIMLSLILRRFKIR